jgi:hypothetical protein
MSGAAAEDEERAPEEEVVLPTEIAELEAPPPKAEETWEIAQ